MTAREIARRAGLNYASLKATLARWSHWHNKYLTRRGKQRLYRYSLASYGQLFLKILHENRPDKELEYKTYLMNVQQPIQSIELVKPEPVTTTVRIIKPPPMPIAIIGRDGTCWLFNPPYDDCEAVLERSLKPGTKVVQVKSISEAYQVILKARGGQPSHASIFRFARLID
jgi:hypothetical protein